jgi:hypothetical protein
MTLGVKLALFTPMTTGSSRRQPMRVDVGHLRSWRKRAGKFRRNLKFNFFRLYEDVYRSVKPGLFIGAV